MEGKQIIVKDLKSLERKGIEADVVILALGVQANNEFGTTLKVRPMETYCIGDCVEPGKAVNAIHQAAFIGREI